MPGVSRFTRSPAGRCVPRARAPRFQPGRSLPVHHAGNLAGHVALSDAVAAGGHSGVARRRCGCGCGRIGPGHACAREKDTGHGEGHRHGPPGGARPGRHSIIQQRCDAAPEGPWRNSRSSARWSLAEVRPWPPSETDRAHPALPRTARPARQSHAVIAASSFAAARPRYSARLRAEPLDQLGLTLLDSRPCEIHAHPAATTGTS